MGVLEGIRHAFISAIPVLVVMVQNAATGETALFGRLDAVGVVITQYPLTIGFVQGQRIANAMRNML